MGVKLGFGGSAYDLSQAKIEFDTEDQVLSILKILLFYCCIVQLFYCPIVVF